MLSTCDVFGYLVTQASVVSATEDDAVAIADVTTLANDDVPVTVNLRRVIADCVTLMHGDFPFVVDDGTHSCELVQVWQRPALPHIQWRDPLSQL